MNSADVRNEVEKRSGEEEVAGAGSREWGKMWDPAAELSYAQTSELRQEKDQYTVYWSLDCYVCKANKRCRISLLWCNSLFRGSVTHVSCFSVRFLKHHIGKHYYSVHRYIIHFVLNCFLDFPPSLLETFRRSICDIASTQGTHLSSKLLKVISYYRSESWAKPSSFVATKYSLQCTL